MNYNYYEVLKPLNYEERLELLDEQIEYLKGLKQDVLESSRKNNELQLYKINYEIKYCEKVIKTVKIWE